MRDLFNSDLPEVAINKPIRLIELFAGYSSQAMALKRIGADFEIWRTSEWLWQSNRSHLAVFHDNKCSDHSVGMTADEVVNALIAMGISADEQKPMTREEIERKGEKWQRQIYNEFKENKNLGSIMNIHGDDLGICDTDKYFYMMTYSFPCQDLSIAGKQKGMTKGSGTRSGLLWEVERILSELPKEKLPQLLFMENVPQVCGEQNQMDFNKWTAFLQKLGYTNYFEILNAKDYGVAQNRERAFMFSFLDEVYYDFPEPIKLEKRLKDYLEDDVDEKYYLNSEKADKLIDQLIASGELNPNVVGGGTESALTEQSRIQSNEKSQTVSPQDTIAESATNNQSEIWLSKKNQIPIYANYNRVDKTNAEVAKTLCARDYKGFGTGFDTMNGVIEYENIDTSSGKQG